MRKTASSAFYTARVMLPVPAKEYTHNRVLWSAIAPYPHLRTAQILAVIAATPQLETPIELVEVEGEHGSMMLGEDVWRAVYELNMRAAMSRGGRTPATRATFHPFFTQLQQRMTLEHECHGTVTPLAPLLLLGSQQTPRNTLACHLQSFTHTV